MTEASSIISIDVGGVFLMDLTVNEAESSADLADISQLEKELLLEAAGNRPLAESGNLFEETTYHLDFQASDENERPSQNNHHYNYNHQQLQQQSNRHHHQQNQQQQRNHQHNNQKHLFEIELSNKALNFRQSGFYLGSSLDRLASIINCDDQQAFDDDSTLQLNNGEENSFIAVKKPKPKPLVSYKFVDDQNSTCSLSDESFVASYGTSYTPSPTGSSYFVSSF